MSTDNLIKNIESLLSNHLKPNTKILKQELKNLTAPGENYGSIMQALDIKIQEPNKKEEILHLVAKRKPANELLCQVFNIQQTFKKEMNVYLKLIPALENFDSNNGNICQISDLFAKCYGGRINLNPESVFVDDDAVIILENLKVIGYEVADRLIGFNTKETYIILNDLAKFHAVPIAYKIKYPEEFENNVRKYLKPIRIDDGFDENMKEIAINEIFIHVKHLKECQPYLEIIKKSLEKCLKDYGAFDLPNEPFATMIHTDFWVNNTMLLTDGVGNPIKNKIVDLQLPGYQSLARDILFFLFSSVQYKILNNLDDFLTFYYEKFIGYLNEYQVDVSLFSREKFELELKLNGFAELGHILIMFKPILTKRGVIDDMSNFDVDTIMKSDIVTDDYGDRVRECILTFIRKNWI